MAIEYSRNESIHHIAPDAKCSICECELAPYLFPVMVYMLNLYICRKCATKNKAGLIADIIELAASEELREYLPRSRLVREVRD